MTIRKDKPLLLSLCVLFVLSLFAACVSCSPSIRQAPTRYHHKYTGEIVNMTEAVQAVLRISNNRVSLVGSAVTLSCQKGKPIRLMTAYHVPEAIEMRDGQGNAPILVGSLLTNKYQQVKILKARPGWDLAILEGLSPLQESCPTVPIASELPEIGSKVWLVGNPLGHEKNITHGILSNVWQTSFFNDKPLVYRIDAAAAPGNSGGGLFNEKGELIGILSFSEVFIFAPIPGGGHAIALPHLWILLKGL